MISHNNTEKIHLKRHADSRNAGRSDIINYVGEGLFTIWIPLTLGYSCSVCWRCFSRLALYVNRSSALIIHARKKPLRS